MTDVAHTEPLGKRTLAPPARRRRKRLALIALTGLLSSILALTTVATASGTPNCESAASDPDGDGWGWENNASCKVVAETASNDNGGAICDDPDGDGWGWDGTNSCQTDQPASVQQPTSNTPQKVSACRSLSSVDSSGWGWENNQSCQALILPHDMSVVRADWVRPDYGRVTFTNSNTMEGLIGFKIYHDGRYSTTILCRGRCDEPHTFTFGVALAPTTLRYGVEPIIDGGGLDYDARRDIFAPLVETSLNPKAAKEPFDVSDMEPANTAIGKAQRALAARSTDMTTADQERMSTQRTYVQAAGSIEITNVTTQTNESLNLELELNGSIDLSMTPSVELGGNVGGATAWDRGRNMDGRPRDGSPITWDRFEDTRRDANVAENEYETSVDDFNQAFDEYVSCSTGGGCAYTDDPVVTVTATPDGGCEDSGNCPGTTTPPVNPPRERFPDCYGDDGCPKEATHDENGRPYCESAASDPDGDGWGWENDASCIVVA